MTRRIETATRRSWRHALSRTRAFSEYLLYGNFVRRSAQQLATHEKVTQSLACAYWDAAPLDVADLKATLDAAPAREVAICVASFSDTPLAMIRSAVGLGEAPEHLRAA